MTRSIFVLALVFALCVSLALRAPEPRVQVDAALAERFEALFEAKDHAGAVTLFAGRSDVALPFVDSFLEGSLAKLEDGSDQPGSAAQKAMHERALFGARAADEAFSSVLFLDYAASFSGWSTEQRANFRAGQKAFGEHRAAMKAKDFETALGHARQCRDLAGPLGDWWGMAMGLGGEGAALLALGRHAEATAPLARARLLNHSLRLGGAEYATLRALVDATIGAGQTERAKAALEHAIATADKRGDEAGAKSLRDRVTELAAK